MTDQVDLSPPPLASAGGLSLRRAALVDLVLPFLAVVLLQRWGAAPLAAYAAASLFPASSVIFTALAKRRVEFVGVIALIAIATGLTAALLIGDARFALLRAAPLYALFGAACFASLLAPRPLMFFVGRAFAGATDPARAAAFDARLAQPGFRRGMRILTVVWGAGAIAAATVNVCAAFLLPGSAAIVAEPIVAIGTVLALLAYTRGFVRRAQNRRP